METNEGAIRPTPEQARAALADTDQVRASVTALSATPWPLWFVTVITAMLVMLPIGVGGTLAEPEWLMPQWAWLVAALAAEVVFLAFFVVAARNWRAGTVTRFGRTSSRSATPVPAVIGMSLLVMSSGYAFKYTGQPLWLFGAAAAGAAVSIGFHLWFVRLHRKTS